ncbi:MAG: hypothetical protein HGA43_16140 [Nitrospirae bacterium]|nr:hypothetical protein [Nitrospirota bacterium]
MRRDLSAAADSALKSFRRRKILTLEEVAGLIGRTVHTARRRLQEWQAHHSYNHNARYYTLPQIPQFDAHGLWRWRGVFFSRAGTLKQTVIELVGRSAAGMDGGELCEILGLDPRSFLSAFADHPQLRREKTRGRFVYYSADPVMGARQRQQRSAMSARNQLPSEFEAIAILVEQIKHPALSVAALSRRLKARQLCVEPHRIQNLFVHHGLAVKKTSHLL